MIMQNRYSGLVAMRNTSRRGYAEYTVMDSIVHCLLFLDDGTHSPGRNPSVLSTGTAFTSKVFRSNCPVVLVAFQAAYVPRSFI